MFVRNLSPHEPQYLCTYVQIDWRCLSAAPSPPTAHPFRALGLFSVSSERRLWLAHPAHLIVAWRVLHEVLHYQNSPLRHPGDAKGLSVAS